MTAQAGAPQPSLLSLRVQIPFWVCTLIWGTTWIVIRDQLGVVPAPWSVTYRFLVAAITMFAYAAITRHRLSLTRNEHLFAMMLGLAQFAFNFNFVYEAEAHVTSGLVALIFALLIVPNTIFSAIFLGTRPSRGFYVGAAVAIAGLALLIANELARARPGQGNVALGIALTLCAVLSASTANVMQGTQIARTMPMPTLLGWAMLWGSLIDAMFAWSTEGPPVLETRALYLAGILYLGVIASAVAFMAYFSLIRMIGAGPAAYSSVIIPAIAMLLSTLFEGYRWSVLAVAGCVLTIAGLVIAMSARSPESKSG